MNSDQLVERASKSISLKVFKVDDSIFYVENSTGKVCYRVTIKEDRGECTCADYQKHAREPNFRCKHLIAALNACDDPEQVKPLQRYKPKLDKQFIKQLQGKDFVLYAGLLDLGHQKGIRRINVEVEQYPTKENEHVAICRAIIESYTGEEYIEWGDANPRNVNSKVAAHILRMAATRAKARALRDFTNIGMTCLDELGGNDEGDEPLDIKTKVSEKPRQQIIKPKESEPSEPPPKNNPIPLNSKQAQGKPSVAQLKAIENLASRRGIKSDMLDEAAQSQFGTSYTELSPSDAAAFIRYLQKSA
jgi:hypothetical protein